MAFRGWLLLQWLRKTLGPVAPYRRARHVRLHVERLEDRITPGGTGGGGGGGGGGGLVITVTTAADDPVTPIAGAVTLRDAITDVNASSSSPKVINFDIPGTPSITLAADLPAITSSVTIDGSTEAGVTVNGNAFAMLTDDSSVTLNDVTLNDVTFTGGTANLGHNTELTVNTGTTLNVSGDLDVGNGAFINNNGTISVGGNFVGGIAVSVNNGEGSSFTVGGNYTLANVVNSATDDPAGPTSGIVTLRDAINAVNSDAEEGVGNPDVISFAILQGAPTITLAADLPTLTNPVYIDGSAQSGVTVHGNGFAMVQDYTTATLYDVTFTGGTASLGSNASLTVDAGSSLSVAGDLDVDNGATLFNYGSLSVSDNFVAADSVSVLNYGTANFGVTGDFTLGDNGTLSNGVFNNAFSSADATLTVGGSITIGTSAVYNYGTSALSVTGNFTLGGNLSNGVSSTDAATLTVGGYFNGGGNVFNIGASSLKVTGDFTTASTGTAVENYGTSALSVTGDFTLGGSDGLANGAPGTEDAATLTVGGTFTVGTSGVVSNNDTSALRVTGDFTLGVESSLNNGDSSAAAATLTVGGSFSIGNSSGNSGPVENEGTSTFTVNGNFTSYGYSNVYNGVNSADAPTLTVGGDFTLGIGYLHNGDSAASAAKLTVGGSFRIAAGAVYNYGTSVLSVADDFTLGNNGFLYNGNSSTDAATLTVGGSFSIGNASSGPDDSEYVYNEGTSTITVTGNFTIYGDGASYVYNGYSSADAATLTVGGSLTIGSSSAGPNDFGYVYNEGLSIFLVHGDFTIFGDRGTGSHVVNGQTGSDAARLTVGGSFSLGANSYVDTFGTNPLTVAGSFTLGNNSYFDVYGAMVVGGDFDPGTGNSADKNNIAGTFTAAPGSTVTTDAATWEVLAGGFLDVEARASFTIAAGGILQIDVGGTLTVASGGTLNGTVQYVPNYNDDWTWTGDGGNANGAWDNPANWVSALSPGWAGGNTINAYPGQGAVANEVDFVTIDTSALATITVQAPDNLSVQSLSTAANDTLAITGGTLTAFANSQLQGPLSMTGGVLAAQGNKVTLTASGATTVTGASLSALDGATLSLPNLVSYANGINPTFFTADGTGSLLNLPAVATLGTLDSLWTIDAQDNGDVNLSALTINSGTTNIQETTASGGQVSTPGTRTIAAGASVSITTGIFTGTNYDLSANAQLTVDGGTFGASFNLAAGASITINGGTFSGTTFNLAAGATVNVKGGEFSGTTTWNVSQGAIVSVSEYPTVSGTWTGTGLGTVQLGNGRLYVGAGGLTLNFAGNMFQWTTGQMDAGQGNLINLGTMNITGPVYFYNDGILDNFGTIIQTGTGNLQLGTDGTYPATLVNEAGAYYLLEGDGGLTEICDGYLEGQTSLNNAGTIRKTAGTGISYFGPAISPFGAFGAITNTGTIEADSGTLFLDTISITQVSVFGTTLTGGTWIAADGATLELYSGISILTNQANLVLSGAGAAITGFAFLASNTGSFTVADGATFSTWGSFVNGGSLTIGAGSTFTVVANFTQTATGTLHGQIGGTPGSGLYGQVDVTGTATLAGAFDLALANDFSPAPGQTFNVISFSSATGNFTSFGGLSPFFAESLMSTGLDLLDAATPAVDLAATSVTAPTTADVGQSITVNWQAADLSIQAITGSWQDSVYLSATPTITSSSTLLGSVPENIALGGGASYSASLTAALPIALTSGYYYVLVDVDSLYQQVDPNRANNTLAATQPINISLPALTLVNSSATYTDLFTAADQNRYYQITVPAGGSLAVSLTSAASSGGTALYVSQGTLPTTFNYQEEASIADQPNQTLAVPVPRAGIYYILAHSIFGVAATAGFTVTVTQRAVVSVSTTGPNSGGNTGSATVEIDGTNFTPATTASLSLGGASIIASAIDFISASQIFATFNLNGAALGSYTLSVQQGSQSVTAPTAFQVTAYSEFEGAVGGGSAAANSPSLSLEISPPQYVRPGRTGTIVITYTNESNIDVIAPLLNIQSTNTAVYFSTPDDPNHYTQDAQVLAVALSGPAGILRPGQSGQLTLTLLSVDTIDGDTIPVQVSQIKIGQTIDWASEEAALQPSGIPTSAWNVIYANYEAIVGTTTDTYNAALAQAATYLSSLGETTAQVSDVATLWSFLVAQADGDYPTTTLTSAVDASLSTPGRLSLAIDRTFMSSIAGRSTPSIFGLGWTTSLQTSLSVNSSGDVTIKSGGALAYFPIQANGSYLDIDGQYGTLTESAGIYTFINTSGIQYVFQQVAPGSSSTLLNYEQDANGNRVTRDYKSQDQLVSLTYSNPSDPAEPTEQLTLTYNAQGFVSEVADGTGDVWIYSYDTAGHLLSVTAPGPTAAGLTTSYTYDTGSNGETTNALLSITNADGSQENFTYDALGRLSATSANGGTEATTFTYLGEAEVKSADSAGDVNIVWFNDLGREARVQDPLGGISTYLFDNNGNLINYTDAAGDTYQYAYDQNGNVTQSVNPLGQTVQTTYNSLNELPSITDASQNTTKYNYSSAGNLLSIAYPDGTQQSFAYDPLGNPTATTLQNGDPINYQYNSQGLVTEVSFADGTYQTFAYDVHGNLITAQIYDAGGDLTGTTTLTYNAANELTSISYPGGLSLTFTYNAAGQRTSSVDQSGYTIDYSYDALGRLSELTDGSGSPIVQYTYNSLGELVNKLNGNGTYTTYAYDPAANLISEINYAPGDTINSSFAYTYNVLNEMTSMTDAGGNLTTYSYNAIGELTQVTLPGGISITYVYNAAGDRTHVINNGAATSYVSNADNEITQVGSTIYTYDANGNLATVTDSSGTTTYTYNDLNQLVSVTASDGTVTTFQYSPLGFMTGTIVNGTQTNYLVDPTGLGNVVAAYTGRGSLIADYNYGIGMASQTGPSGTGYYDFDASGNTVGITGSTGTYVNRYSYLPFGETTTISAALPNPFTFAGQAGATQIGSDLFSMRARDYTPVTGQFLSNDPLGLAAGNANVRTYVSNDPTNGVDPTGLIYLTLSDFINSQGEEWLTNLTQDAYFGARDAAADGVPTAAQVAENTEALLQQAYQWKQAGTAFGTAAGRGLIGELQGFGIGAGGFDFAPVVAGLPWVAAAVGGLGVGFLGGSILVHFVPEFGRIYRLWPDDPFLNMNQPYIHNVTSQDPNSLIGPAGYGTDNFIPDSGTLPYTIDFENDGTAAALDVTVTEQLDPNVDWSTFQLGSFGFGSVNVNIPAGLTQYQTTVSYQNSDGSSLNVVVTLDFNVQTGLLTATFVSLDPSTGQAPTGVFDGFLYPESQSAVDSNGYVQYTVQPSAGLATGNTVNQQASVVFDTNAALGTAIVTNTIDAGAPTSSVSPLPANVTAPFTVTWSGQDDTGGSGIASFDIYYSVNGSATYTLWQTNTTATSALFTGTVGDTYSFYSIATDNVGNVQSTPGEVQTAMVVPAQTTTTLTDNGPNPSTAGQSVSFTVTMTGGVPDGEVVTLEDQCHSDMVVGTGVLMSGTITIPVSSLLVGPHEIYAVYTGDANLAGSMSVDSLQTVVTAPAVLSVVVNGDPGDSLAGSNSRVATLYVTFNEAVQLDSGAFTLALHNDVAVNGVAGQQVGTLPGTAQVPGGLQWSSSDNIHWTVTFVGSPGVNVSVGADGYITIMDGVYDLTIVASNVHPLGSPTVDMASSVTQTFWALFGDSGANDGITSGTLGDGHTTISIGMGDFNAFAGAFGSAGYAIAQGYNPIFDTNGDGSIDVPDFDIFADDFGTCWKF